MPGLGALLKKKRTKNSSGSRDLKSPASPVEQAASTPIAQVHTDPSTNLLTSKTTKNSTTADSAAERNSGNTPITKAVTEPASKPPPPPPKTEPEPSSATTGAQPTTKSQMNQPVPAPYPANVAGDTSSQFRSQPQPSSQHHNVASIKNIINPPHADESVSQRSADEQAQYQSQSQLQLQQHQQQQQQQARTAAQRQLKGKYTLEDFTLRRTLGTGSFGRVHLVQSKHNQRFYAIKVLKKAQVVKMKQVEHTNDERRMLQRVRHPFLITLWGTFQDSKNLYMVMDFVEGGELFSLLRKSQRFPNPVAKFYAAEVVLALEYLHAQDIVYRDLKPENLLLDRHGHLKITDFGFAKEVLDITWTLCGTPDYLAPEVVSSKGYNKSVDWWSLGILIFEMLCGFTPFWDGRSPIKIYENILQARVKYPPYMHTDAQDLLSQLITPDLTKRLGNLHGGPEDVKNHPWFGEVTWDRLFRRDIDAPYVPPVKGGQGDASLFDTYPEETEQYGSEGDDQFGHYFAEF